VQFYAFKLLFVNFFPDVFSEGSLVSYQITDERSQGKANKGTAGRIPWRAWMYGPDFLSPSGLRVTNHKWSEVRCDLHRLFGCLRQCAS